MRRPTLSESHSRDGRGRLVSEYEHDGQTWLVCDSARNVLLMAELFADQELTEAEKAALLPVMALSDPEGDMERCGSADAFWRMLAAVLWDAAGIDMTGEHAVERERPVFDWEEDAERVRASLLMAYGLDWDEHGGSMTYRDACGLLSSLMESGQETPFQQAVYHRTAKPPKRTKYNGELVEAFEKRREHYRLKGRDRITDEQRMRAADEAMAAEFAAAERAAERRAARG